jgi:phage gpG-like protein
MAVKIKRSRRREFKRNMERLDGASVKVGIQGAKAVERREGGITMAELGAVHEFGNDRIPQRPFLRPIVNEKKHAKAITKTYKKIKTLEGSTIDQALGAAGEKAVNIAQRRIAQGIDPANAPSTIARKGSSKPLIDTGRLRQSITWRLDK